MRRGVEILRREWPVTAEARLVVFPLAPAGFLVCIIHLSVPGLGSWSGRDLVSLYVMRGIAAAIMLYVRFWDASDSFSMSRETYQPATAD
jgi:hypothetical protein